MPSEIAVPFRVGGDGRLVTVSDPDVQVRQHVRALINTQPDERVMVPGYGTPTNSLLFEDVDGDDLAAQASIMVEEAVRIWEPGVALKGITIDPTTEGSFAKINVDYSRKDSADSGTVANSNTAIIGEDGVVREIVRG